MNPPATEPSARRVQLHLVLAYKFSPREHPRVKRYLEQGYRIAEYQRLTDREVLVTLEAKAAEPDAPLQP